jgi:hypothetical protein
LNIPYIGFVLDFARQPLGFILLIAFPAALVILNELIDIFKEIKKFYRRRRGGTESKDDNLVKSVIWRKINKMDDVLRPVIMLESFGKKRTNSSVIASVLILVTLSMLALRPGATSSYFADDENSTGNTFSAVSYEASAIASPLESYISTSGGANIVSSISFNPSLPSEYYVSVEEVGGPSAFCQALLANSSSTPPFTYNGSLLGFNSAPTSYVGTWDMDVSLDQNARVFVAEDICVINLVYSAKTWLEDKGVSGGYSDTAKVSLIFKFQESDQGGAGLLLQTFALPEEVVEQDATSTEPVLEEATTTEPVLEEVVEVVETEEVVDIVETEEF